MKEEEENGPIELKELKTENEVAIVNYYICFL